MGFFSSIGHAIGGLFGGGTKQKTKVATQTTTKTEVNVNPNINITNAIKNDTRPIADALIPYLDSQENMLEVLTFNSEDANKIAYLDVLQADSEAQNDVKMFNETKDIVMFLIAAGILLFLWKQGVLKNAKLRL